MHSFPPARPDARTSQLACLPLFPRGSLIAFHCVPFASSVYRLAGQWCLPYHIRSSVKNDDRVLALVSPPQGHVVLHLQRPLRVAGLPQSLFNSRVLGSSLGKHSW